MDDEFLVVWDGYADPPWKSLKESELRSFLKASLESRVEEFGRGKGQGGLLLPLEPRVAGGKAA